jgi:hypothetical protein
MMPVLDEEDVVARENDEGSRSRFVFGRIRLKTLNVTATNDSLKFACETQQFALGQIN